MLHTREEMQEELQETVKVLSQYGCLQTNQIYRMFPGHDLIVATILRKLKSSGRAVGDWDRKYIAADPDKLKQADEKVIRAFWVLLSFWESIEYHIPGEYPVCISFFMKGQVYEIIYAARGEEKLISFMLEPVREYPRRIIIVEQKEQIPKLNIQGVVGYCTVDADGTISHFYGEEVKEDRPEKTV